MTKYVIDTVELIKKQYVIESYLPADAIELTKERAPVIVEVLSDTVYGIHPINEYEYNKEWKPLDPDIGPDQLKDTPPDQRELFELEPNLWRDD